MSINTQPITVDSMLFFQMLAQVADGANATTANLADRLGIAFDPDEGPIVITQGRPIITQFSGIPSPTEVIKIKKSPRTPSGYVK